jgi:hypothetical protein
MYPAVKINKQGLGVERLGVQGSEVLPYSHMPEPTGWQQGGHLWWVSFPSASCSASQLHTTVSLSALLCCVVPTGTSAFPSLPELLLVGPPAFTLIPSPMVLGLLSLLCPLCCPLLSPPPPPPPPPVHAPPHTSSPTGFMSNRGRQNVASYLALDLGVDWRRGADWFEHHLLDYDVASNWGNWVAAAGLTGGRVNHFNITKQSKVGCTYHYHSSCIMSIRHLLVPNSHTQQHRYIPCFHWSCWGNPLGAGCLIWLPVRLHMLASKHDTAASSSGVCCCYY